MNWREDEGVKAARSVLHPLCGVEDCRIETNLDAYRDAVARAVLTEVARRLDLGHTAPAENMLTELAALSAIEGEGM